jgi:hypothetical protein
VSSCSNLGIRRKDRIRAKEKETTGAASIDRGGSFRSIRMVIRRKMMEPYNNSAEPKKTSETASFDSDGPWANAWHMDPQMFSYNKNQVQMDPRKSDKPKKFSKRHSPFS